MLFNNTETKQKTITFYSLLLNIETNKQQQQKQREQPILSTQIKYNYIKKQ